MTFQGPRQLILWCVLLILVAYIKASEHGTTSPHSEEDNSSTGEVQDYYDEQQPSKRSTDDGGRTGLSPRLSIPGIPDANTILKIAEAIKIVSEQVVPLLVSGINNPVEKVSEHLNRDLKLLRGLKNKLNVFGDPNQNYCIVMQSWRGDFMAMAKKPRFILQYIS